MPEAYEQVLVDAMSKSKSIFTTSQEIIESWRILQPILNSWSLSSDDIIKYEQGVDPDEIAAQN